MSLNISNEGEQCAVIIAKDKKPVKIFCTEEDTKKGFNYMTIKQDDPAKFYVTPLSKHKRTSYYIIGKNGSGKSYKIKEICHEFIKMFPNMPIRLISSKNEDEELDSIPRIKRIKIDNSIVENPINYEDLKESLIIFDDIDGFSGDIKKAVYYLRDIILQNGRSYKINIISSSHDFGEKINSVALSESDIHIFYMKNYNRKLKYYLESYIGLEMNDINYLKKRNLFNSRSIAYVSGYPCLLIMDKDISTVDNFNEFCQLKIRKMKD